MNLTSGREKLYKQINGEWDRKTALPKNVLYFIPSELIFIHPVLFSSIFSTRQNRSIL